MSTINQCYHMASDVLFIFERSSEDSFEIIKPNELISLRTKPRTKLSNYRPTASKWFYLERDSFLTIPPILLVIIDGQRWRPNKAYTLQSNGLTTEASTSPKQQLYEVRAIYFRAAVQGGGRPCLWPLPLALSNDFYIENNSVTNRVIR